MPVFSSSLSRIEKRVVPVRALQIFILIIDQRMNIFKKLAVCGQPHNTKYPKLERLKHHTLKTP